MLSNQDMGGHANDFRGDIIFEACHHSEDDDQGHDAHCHPHD